MSGAPALSSTKKMGKHQHKSGSREKASSSIMMQDVEEDSILPTKSAAKVSSSVIEPFCMICLNDHCSHVSMGVCNHTICSLCALRLRYKSKDYNCPVCKTPLEVMVTFDIQEPHMRGMKFVDFGLSNLADLNDIFNGAPTSGSQVDLENKMIYYHCKQHFIDMMNKKSLHCPFLECAQVKVHMPNYKTLLQHLNSVHKLTMCSLCLENRPLFIDEHQVMTKTQLSAHMSGGKQEGLIAEQDNAFANGHPKCEFCNINVFDKNALYNHLQKEHTTCPLCDQSMMFRYYKDIGSLREHHRNDHYMCHVCDKSEEMVS